MKQDKVDDRAVGEAVDAIPDRLDHHSGRSGRRKLSFCNQPTLIPIFHGSTASKNRAASADIERVEQPELGGLVEHDRGENAGA